MWYILTHPHTLQFKGSFNDVQAHLHNFHLEVQQGRGAIPINLETPASLRKRYKSAHHGAYVHETGGGSTLSDVEVSIVVVPSKVFLHVLNTNGMVKFDIDGREAWGWGPGINKRIVYFQ